MAKIEELGGFVSVDEDAPDQPITSLMLQDSNISDASCLRLLREMPDLKQLNMRHVLVGDILAEQLPNWTELTYVSLGDSRVTDSGVAHLSKLQHLTELSLESTRITDAALKSLYSMTQLQHLNVDVTRTTVDGVLAIRGALPKCRVND